MLCVKLGEGGLRHVGRGRVKYFLCTLHNSEGFSA